MLNFTKSWLKTLMVNAQIEIASIVMSGREVRLLSCGDDHRPERTSAVINLPQTGIWYMVN